VYLCWFQFCLGNYCEAQTYRVPGAIHKSFPKLEDAIHFRNNGYCCSDKHTWAEAKKHAQEFTAAEDVRNPAKSEVYEAKWAARQEAQRVEEEAKQAAYKAQQATLKASNVNERIRTKKKASPAYRDYIAQLEGFEQQPNAQFGHEFDRLAFSQS
jgi:hypothetical protein